VGFTLIELMIVVAIIGILASIAIPQYLRFTTKARRTEGIAILSGLHKTQISYFASEDAFPQTAVTPLYGEFPPQLGYALLGPSKFYIFDADPSEPSPIYLDSDLNGNRGEGYAVLFKGQLDGDDQLDYLCIAYPVATAACGSDAQPGQVFVFLDDVLLN